MSATFWNKRVTNFVGNSVVQEPLYGITDPTSGPTRRPRSPSCRAGPAAQVASAGRRRRCGGLLANATALFTAVAMLRNEAAA